MSFSEQMTFQLQRFGGSLDDGSLSLLEDGGEVAGLHKAVFGALVVRTIVVEGLYPRRILLRRYRKLASGRKAPPTVDIAEMVNHCWNCRPESYTLVSVKQWRHRIGSLRLDREAKAHLSAEANGAGSSGASSGAKVGESEGRALASHQLIGKGMDQEVFKRADLEAFFKALKESGNTLGNTLGYSYAAHTLPTLTLLRVSRV
ncbi:hypothetical protein F2Q69_00020179 [Brassica cretica]|uniref:Uncharacterized protein n=1 Tax=Brassica cretica TaxID=69181 RepID=A0A8S9QHC9_BRACR|nr:hypothetical protein F2Q69_00020179 [Brassica cretica]